MIMIFSNINPAEKYLYNLASLILTETSTNDQINAIVSMKIIQKKETILHFPKSLLCFDCGCTGGEIL